MIADEYIELINQEIDGVNSAEASAKLKAHLLENPEAQAYIDGLTAMSDRLHDEARSGEAPEPLYNHVMQSIDPNRYVAESRQGVFTGLRDFLGSKINLKVAFSGGLVVGVAIYALFASISTTSTAPDRSQITGTFGLEAPIERPATIELLEIDLEAVTGSLRFRKADKLVIAEIALEARQPVDFLLAFDERTIGIKGITFPVTQATNSFVVENSTFRLACSGMQSMIILFEESVAAEYQFECMFKLGNDSIYEKTIVVNPASK